MKNLFFIFCLLFLLLSLNSILFSQLTNRWEFEDTSKLQYSGYSGFSNFYYHKTGIMAGIDENDFVVVGGDYNMVYFRKNLYVIKRYTDSGNNIDIIYNDTVNVAQRIHSVSHPVKNVIVAVGDTNNYLGIWGSTEYYKSFGMILLTTDAGATWERKTIDSNKTFRCVSMCDSLNGIILQSDLDNYFNPKDELYDSLLITSYGWKTINKIPLPEDAGFVFYCWCLTPQKYYIHCRSKSDGTEFLYLTTDGGMSWNQSTHLPPGIIIDDIKFISDKNIFVAANRAVESSASPWEPVIYKSSNGGVTWRECNNVFREIREDVFRLYSIDFCDSLNGIAVGGEGKILRTSDGGETWDREYSPFIFSKPKNDNTLKSVFYPQKDFAFSSWSSDYTMKCINNRTLSKPIFYKIFNAGHQPLNNVKISWTYIKGAERYRLKVDTTQSSGLTGGYDFDNSLIDTIVIDTIYIIKSLDSHTVYHSWVKSINDSMESDWGDENSGFTTITSENDLYSPNLTYPFYASRVDNTKVTLRWNKVSTAERYHLLVTNDFNNDNYAELLTDTTYTIKDLVPSAFYYITLESIRGIFTSYKSWSYFRTRDVLGVDDEIINSNYNVLNIYPNPFSNYITIDIEGNNKSETIIIYDNFGRTVKTILTDFLGSFTTYNFTLSVESLPPGVYFVRLLGKAGAKVMIKTN
ncbi:MAG: T9SS type A sorting domain-containing protein [Bacteroidetes bacterium]|nr:MAG: T9SS type A sorting domain-containing protein [Bacteroidota bacterium]